MSSMRISGTWKLHELVVSALTIVLSVYFLTTPNYAFAIMPGLVLILLYVLWRWPQFGLYGILFSLPFNAYSSISEYITITQVFGGLLIIILAAKVLLNRIPLQQLNSNLWKWAVFFLIISFLSTFLSDYKETAIPNLKNILIVLTIFAFTLALISSRGFRKTLPKIIVVSITISSLLLIIGSVFEISFLYIGAAIPVDNRASGTAEDPNEMAAMILFTLPLIIHQLSHASKRSHKVFLLLVLVTNVSAVILTYSRSAGLIMAILVGSILLRKIRKLRASQIGFGIAVAAGIIVMILAITPATYWERQKSVFYSGSYIEDGSLAGRLSFILAAIEVFPQNPVIGAGPGTYRDKYSETGYAPEYGYDEDKQGREAAHNAYIEILIGHGILGMIFYVAIILVALKNFSAAQQNFLKKGNDELAGMTRAYRFGMFALLLFFFFLSTPYDKYYWISLALSQLALRYSIEEEVESVAVTADAGNATPENLHGTPSMSFR